MGIEQVQKYAGSEWVKSALQVTEMSHLGEKVADILGQAWSGIYHLDDTRLKKVEWRNHNRMSICVMRINSHELSQLDVCCRARSLIIEIRPAGPNNIRIMFWNRE